LQLGLGELLWVGLVLRNGGLHLANELQLFLC
jgi:hypothetical protein